MPSTRTLQAARNKDETEWKSNDRFGIKDRNCLDSVVERDAQPPIDYSNKHKKKRPTVVIITAMISKQDFFILQTRLVWNAKKPYLRCKQGFFLCLYTSRWKQAGYTVATIVVFIAFHQARQRGCAWTWASCTSCAASRKDLLCQSKNHVPSMCLYW